jgi:RimJ/RimL family protein N-acetyltransferase
MVKANEMTSADHDVELANETIRLRAFRTDDADAIYAAVRESMRELGEWLSWCHPDYAIEDTMQFLAARGEAFRNEGEYSFAILERSTGRFLGACGLNQIDKATLRANLGYWLRTSATGHGHATEAVRLLARWAFDQIGFERIEIVAATGNHASQRVAIRAGANREGIARNRLRVHGVQHDAVVFSLIPGDGERLWAES